MPRPVEAAALAHMRQLLEAGWHSEAMMKDATLEALSQRGFPKDVSQRAVDAMWQAHFAITTPN